MMSSSSRVGKRLSERLKSLRKYHHKQPQIRDIGCDHGLLGMSFYDNEEVKRIHLVDPSAAVIERLKTNYKDSYITDGKLIIIHSKGQNIKIDTLSNCIFIAGMGGKEMGEIIDHILPQLDPDSQLVISPHRKILELREKLKHMPVSLVTEEVIHDENQFYQIMVLRPGSGEKVSSFGEELWKSEVGEMYRLQQLNIYGPHKDNISIRYLEYLKNMVI